MFINLKFRNLDLNHKKFTFLSDGLASATWCQSFPRVVFKASIMYLKAKFCDENNIETAITNSSSL